MKKKTLITSFILFSLSLCSCSLNKDYWEEHKNDDFSMNLMSDKFENYNLSFDFDGYELDMQNAIQIIRQQSSIGDLQKVIIKININTYSLLSKRTIAMTRYYGNPTNENKEIYLSFYNEFNKYSLFFVNMKKEAQNSSDEIKNYFFNTTDSSEIAKIISNLDGETEAIEHQSSMDSIANEMSTLQSQGVRDAAYEDQAIDLYLSYINEANQLASLYDGYDSYLEYTYENEYSRDYTISDAKTIASLIKQYVVPFLNQNEFVTPNGIDTIYYNKIRRNNFCNRDTEMSDYFESFASDMSTKYRNYYNHLWGNGYYYFSDNSNSLSTAYVAGLYTYSINDYVAYFSANYQNILSVMHEFGHYFSMKSNYKNTQRSIDINETFSQGNEFIFLNYLKENSDNFTIDYFADKYVYDELSYLANFAYIVELEDYAFHENSLTKEKLQTKITSLKSEYSNCLFDYYWCYPCVACSGYYISYASSLVAALQFYTMDFATSKSKYLTLTGDSSDKTTFDLWTSNGLYSPKDPQSYTTILNYISTLL